jgi:hypothetical protein
MRKLAGNVAAIIFVYLLIFHYATFAAFWSPILNPIDPSTNLTALVAFFTPAAIGIFVGALLYRIRL